MNFLGGIPPVGGHPYGALQTPGMPNGLAGAHPVSEALFHSLVRAPGKRTGKPPKIKGKLPLGLPFHSEGVSGGIGGGNFRKPMVGGISKPGARL